MSNQIAKQNSLPASLTEAISMGKAMFESGLFTDLKSAAQAVVKIQAGAEIGIPPFAALTGIHIIQGKPSIGAGLMAARVKGSGKYDYRVVQNDEKACSIDFYQGADKIGNSTFTIEDAKKAQTKNIDKHPKNMLFARAMSNGVKWFTPDVFAGPVYVPEEISEIVTEDVPHEVVWLLTDELAQTASDLINNSTLDANDRIIAMNSVSNCKSLAEYDKVVNRLRQLQTAS